MSELQERRGEVYSEILQQNPHAISLSLPSFKVAFRSPHLFLCSTVCRHDKLYIYLLTHWPRRACLLGPLANERI